MGDFLVFFLIQANDPFQRSGLLAKAELITQQTVLDTFKV